MRTRKRTVRTVKPDDLELLPRAEGMKRADELLRTLLNSPPDPHTSKPAKKKRERR